MQLYDTNPQIVLESSKIITDCVKRNCPVNIEELFDGMPPNVSVLVVKGIMHMLDSELEYLVERGAEFIQEEYLAVKKEMFKNTDNIIVFPPKKIKDN